MAAWPRPTVQAVMGIIQTAAPMASPSVRTAVVHDVAGAGRKTLAQPPARPGGGVSRDPEAHHSAGRDLLFLRVDGEAKLVAILQNRVVGILAGVENQALILPKRGLEVTVLSYPDIGVNTEGLAILAATDTFAEKNICFVIATRMVLRGRAKGHSKESITTAGVKVKTDMDHDLSLAQLKAVVSAYDQPAWC